MLAATLAAPLSLAGAAAGCGGPKVSGVAQGPSPAAADGGDASASADAAPPPRPFAGSAAEATQLIEEAVEKKAPQVQRCLLDYRGRKNLPRERVTIQLGIDQEGHLLGATLPKGKADATFSECLQRALAGAPFPRSHAGVISVTRTYEEIVQ
jgi:hypothetical protein